ncbi:hypothetical protein [Ferrimonas balearica]|uniref:hypothetical protein n=1 Tax=Ferrimonas balearica TaxID=44012 RepID=UPI001C98F227|nr:hypothetical protein [Ferrimonas balearica]MBY5921740.1 hypothetical protein [Ferrimonas balearica]MBY5994920.1 hypothetical protein [Ferrimonas balearica]
MSRVGYRLGQGLMVASLPLAMWLKVPWLTFALAGLGQGLVLIAYRLPTRKRVNRRTNRAYGRQRPHGHRHLVLAH